MTKESFEQLYIQLLPGLYRLAVSILYHREDAMDAVQQAAEKAWKVTDRIQCGREKAYIVRIVINECRNIQRYRKRVVPRSDFPEEKTYDGNENPELYAAICGLPEKYRLPLLMKYMEGFSEKEIAETLHISESAVKSRLHRAKNKLKDIILEKEGEEL